MSKYNKLWGFIGSQVLGLLIGLLAFAGVAECTIQSDPTTCTVFGMSYGVMQVALNSILGAIGVYQAPANTE